MTESERALVLLSAAIASSESAALDAAIDRVATLAPQEAEEAILQSYLFVGYPAALQALGRWRDRTKRPAPAQRTGDADTWAERGARVCATVYGGQYDRLRANINALHPDLEEWMLVEGYGKVLGRPGLSLRLRELCIIVLLAAQPAHAQLYSHLRGALNAGASEADIEGALDATAQLRSAERNAAALTTWSEIKARRGEGRNG